jgi:hypothetical protein
MAVTMNIVAMIALILLGLAFTITSQFDDRSLNWINLTLAAVCLAGAFVFRPRSHS